MAVEAQPAAAQPPSGVSPLTAEQLIQILDETAGVGVPPGVVAVVELAAGMVAAIASIRDFSALTLARCASFS